MHVLILAGGGGTRLWPVSRERQPKQFQKILGDTTLLAMTYERLRKRFRPADIFVATSKEHARAVYKELPEIPRDHYFIEPVRRETGPAIGLAAAFFAHKDPDAIFTTANADHLIRNERAYFQALTIAEKAARAHPDHLVMLGVRPTYPETGYGYVRVESRKSVKSKVRKVESRKNALAVERFVEKPDLTRAKTFIASGDYLWNPGLFVFRAATLLDRFAEHLPKTHRILQEIVARPSRRASLFRRIEPISIDYGILEKTKKILVVPTDCGWADIGHWRTVYDVRASHGRANVAHEDHLGIESAGNLIIAPKGKLVATLGIHDMIIVDTPDALLVCPRGRAQEVKHIIAALKKNGMKKFL